MQIHLPTLSIADAERRLIELALTTGGCIVNGARLLGITNHALKRRIIKYRIEWPRSSPLPSPVQGGGRLDPEFVTNPGIVIDGLNLAAAERKLVERALKQAGSIVEAAPLLGLDRHSTKRRMIKHGIMWQSVHPAHAHVRMGGGL